MLMDVGRAAGIVNEKLIPLKSLAAKIVIRSCYNTEGGRLFWNVRGGREGRRKKEREKKRKGRLRERRRVRKDKKKGKE